MTNLLKILVLPAWLLHLVERPFLDVNHPWHGKTLSLESMAMTSTVWNRLVSVFTWILVAIDFWLIWKFLS